MLAFTRTGEHGMLWLWLSALAAVVDPPQRALYARSAGTVSVAYAANIALKYATRRRRPRLEGLPALSSTVTGLSFPSAHATTSFAAARVLSRGLPPAPLYTVATAMALSRPYAGVHYPSDILAGAALGTAMAELLR